MSQRFQPKVMGVLAFILASGAHANEDYRAVAAASPEVLNKALSYAGTKVHTYHYTTQSNAVMTGRQLNTKPIIVKPPIEIKDPIEGGPAVPTDPSRGIKGPLIPIEDPELPAPLGTEHQSSLLQNLKVVLEIQSVGSKFTAEAGPMIRMRIVSAEIQNESPEGNESSILDGDYLSQLQVPIYFVQNSKGSIEKIYKHAKEATEITNFKRGIISAFQTRMISTKEAVRAVGLAVLDKDALGELKPEYAPASVDQAGNVIVQKTWNELSYTKPVATDGDTLPMKIGDATLQGVQKTMINPTEGVVSQVDIQVSMQTQSAAISRSAVPLQGIDTRTDVLAKGSLKLMASKVGKPTNFNSAEHVATDLAMEPVPIDMESIDEAIPGLEVRGETFKAYRQAQLLTRLRHHEGMAHDIVRQIQAPNLDLNKRLEWTGILAQEGSPHSQKAVLDSVLTDPSLPVAVREHALCSLVLVEKPTSELKDAVASLLDGPQPELRRAAASALGAMLHKSASGPESHHLGLLHTYLTRPWSEDELLIGISALGNAGKSASLIFLTPYLEHASARVRMETVEALRNMEDDQAATLLLDRAQLDESPAVRHLAFSYLNIAETAAPATRSTLLDRSWEKQLGSGSIYAKLHGRVYVTENPFHLEANAGATGYAYGLSKNLIKAEVKGDVTGSSDAQRFAVNGGLYIVGSKIWTYSDSFACNVAREQTWGNTYNFFTLSTSIPIFGPLSVYLGAGMNGSASFKARGELNGCGITSAFAKANLTPSLTVGAYAEAGLSLVVIRGGLRFQANLVSGSMPSMFMGSLSTSGFQARGDVDLVLNPLSAKLDAWYQWRKWRPFRFYWGGGNSWTLWSWSLPNKTWHVIDVRVP